MGWGISIFTISLESRYGSRAAQIVLIKTCPWPSEVKGVIGFLMFRLWASDSEFSASNLLSTHGNILRENPIIDR